MYVMKNLAVGQNIAFWAWDYEYEKHNWELCLCWWKLAFNRFKKNENKKKHFCTNIMLFMSECSVTVTNKYFANFIDPKCIILISISSIIIWRLSLTHFFKEKIWILIKHVLFRFRFCLVLTHASQIFLHIFNST